MTKLNLNQYFQTNYGLGKKPEKTKEQKKKDNRLLIIGILGAAAGFAWWPLFLVGALFIAIFAIKKASFSKKLKEWEDEYQYRENNWHKEFDQKLNEKINSLNIKQKALKRLNLDETQVGMSEKERKILEEKGQKVNANGLPAPVQFRGVNYDNGWRRHDGKYRTGNNYYTYIFFTDEQVLVYTVEFNMFNDEITEKTREYFYQDITNFSTEEETKEVENKDTTKNEKVKYETFKIIVPGDSYVVSISTYNDETEQNIQAMKQLLRNKKNEMHRR